MVGPRGLDATLVDTPDADASEVIEDVPPDMPRFDVIDVTRDGGMDADVADASDADVLTCATLAFDVPTVDVPADALVRPDAAADASLPAAPALQVEASLASTGFTCFALTSAQGRCVGDNNLGQLGDNTTAQRTRPVPVGNLFGAQQLVAGDAFACAALDNGTVRCWGANSFGQLGDNSTSDHRTAQPVTGITAAAQPRHVLGLRAEHGLRHQDSAHG